jgi:hypothetical protein
MELALRIKVLLGAAVAVCAAAWAFDNATPLNIKPGYWETTVTMSRSGAPPIPPEVLARMPAEQRARIEERMKASAAQGPQTHVTKHCVTKEDLAKSFGAFDDNPNCKRTILASSARSLDFKLECTNQGMVTSGTGHVEAIDSEHTSGKVKMSVAAGAQTMTVENTFSSKLLGEACPEKK